MVKINPNADKKTYRISDQKIANDFDDFFGAYPEPTGEKYTKILFMRLMCVSTDPKKLFEEIMQGLKNQKQAAKIKERTIPGFRKTWSSPQNWLNGERWKDPVQISDRPKPKKPELTEEEIKREKKRNDDSWEKQMTENGLVWNEDHTLMIRPSKLSAEELIKEGPLHLPRTAQNHLIRGI